MSRALKITMAILVVLVTLGFFALPSLRRGIALLSGSSRTEAQGRREVMQPPISTPSDIKEKAQLYWLASGSDSALEATPVNLSLSADPVERSKQLLSALIANAPTADRRTLPVDTSLLAFYLRPDGTAIADFSDELSLKTPSGILSEQLAVDSIVQTLGANVSSIRQLKILIHGQAAETLAGHVDLSGLFPVVAPAPPEANPAAPSAAPSVTNSGGPPSVAPGVVPAVGQNPVSTPSVAPEPASTPSTDKPKPQRPAMPPSSTSK